jgi:K+-transporting ATPase ATPase C chain
MRSEFRAAVVLLLLFTVLAGGIYPLLVTGAAKLAFPRQAEGGLIALNGHLVGSRLVGQPFDDPKYFWGRLSATSPVPYEARASAGSNYGPLNPALLDAARARIATLQAADPEARGPVPVDLVTASGSGLDPDLSPAAAEFQAARVARVRGLALEQVQALVRAYTRRRTFGVLGEPRVNVLELNLALDALAGGRPAREPR